MRRRQSSLQFSIFSSLGAVAGIKEFFFFFFFLLLTVGFKNMRIHVRINTKGSEMPLFLQVE